MYNKNNNFIRSVGFILCSLILTALSLNVVMTQMIDFTTNPDAEGAFGKGFGHGVGLCQEGAMKMAKSGYTYGQILHFYYKNVHMINLESLSFFKADY